MATSSQDTCQLELTRHLHAAPQRVFEAWTSPEALKRWFGPTPDHAVIVHALDVRVGGTFRIELRHVRGASHVVVGVYRVVEPHSRLAFTWRWEDQPGLPETLVTVALRDTNPGTDMTLRHEGFPDELSRARHMDGWTGCTGRLDDGLAV
ncbi:MAG: SRPBCC domain-containing protein [Gemmatimonadaceae bacterium]